MQLGARPGRSRPSSGGESASVHFWLDDHASWAGAARWAPDGEPSRFATGPGHNVVELYARLRQRGRPVTIGPGIPRATRLVVAYGWSLGRRSEAALAVRSLRIAWVLIRGDVPLDWDPIRTPDLVVLPNSAPSWRSRTDCPSVSLLPLPQRGLVPRDPARRGRISLAAFKGFRSSLPAYLEDMGFRTALSRRGVGLTLDVPHRADHADQHWHDFSDVDVALCVRSERPRGDLDRKPATRLVNAWLAGSIPLIDPEPAYLEMGTHEKDCLIVDGPGSIIAAIERLAAEPALVARLQSGVAARRGQVSPEQVLDAWDELLFERAWPRVSLRRTARGLARLSSTAICASLARPFGTQPARGR